MKVIAIVFDDRNAQTVDQFDTVVDSENKCLEYMKEKLTFTFVESFNNWVVKVYDNAIAISSDSYEEVYRFIEVDMDQRYANHTDITNKIVFQLRDYMTAKDWDYRDYYGQRRS